MKLLNIKVAQLDIYDKGVNIPLLITVGKKHPACFEQDVVGVLVVLMRAVGTRGPGGADEGSGHLGSWWF